MALDDFGEYLGCFFMTPFSQTMEAIWTPPFCEVRSAFLDEESRSSISGLVRGIAAGPDEIR